MAPITIEVWSDVVCPFCWIGKRHLQQAIDQAGLQADVRVVDHPFQLDPTLRASEPLVDHLAAKFGGAENARRMIERVRAMGASAGLSFDFERAISAPTFDAHRLVRLARDANLGEAMLERLMRAHFTEAADLADHATLRRLALDVGLDAAAVDALLSTDQHAEDVRERALEAHALGARGVPFFVIDRKLAIAGAQPVELFVQALQRAREAPAQSS